MAKKKVKSTIRAGVVGSGSFATAIVKMLLENVENVRWAVRDEYTKGSLEHHGHNPNYLSMVDFDVKHLKITTDVNEVVENCDVIVLATPSIYLDDALKNMNASAENRIFISAIKGIVPCQNDVVAHYLEKRFKIPFENQAVIAGPCHAEEIAMERLSYLTIATMKEENSKTLQDLFSSNYIKINRSKDIIGNEYAAILKNIYAIGAGIAGGLGYGDNFQAVYATNAIREMKNFLDSVAPENRDVNDSSYLGDLLVTCYSLFSRNRNLGNLIGKGYTVKSAIQSMNMVAEGYYAVKGIYEIAKNKNLQTPIINHIYGILYEEKNAEKQFEKLVNRLN